MKGFAQIISRNGLGETKNEYVENVYMRTTDKGVDFTIMNHIPIYNEKYPDVVNGFRDVKIHFIPAKIEFCDVGVYIENADKSVNIIFSENPNGPIAKCAEDARLKAIEESKKKVEK